MYKYLSKYLGTKIQTDKNFSLFTSSLLVVYLHLMSFIVCVIKLDHKVSQTNASILINIYDYNSNVYYGYG